jgi:hypothetical protein
MNSLPRPAAAPGGPLAEAARRSAGLALGLVVCLGIQSATPASGQSGSDWRLVDGILAQVDDQIVTFSEVDEQVLRSLGRAPASSPDQLAQRSSEALTESVRARVFSQGGRELGVGDDGVRRVVEQFLEERRREAGPVDHGARLRAMGDDPLMEERQATAELYRALWMNTITGREGVAAERPRVDRFVRPAELRAVYLQNRDLLGDPDVVSLQLIEVLAVAVGGLDVAREIAEECAERARAGADYDGLVREYSASYRDTLGRVPPLAVTAIGDPLLRQFAQGARVAEISAVMPVLAERSGRPVGFRVARMLERSGGGPPPAFDQPGLQRELRQRVQERRDEEALTRAAGALEASAHLWVHPSLGPRR